MPRIKLAWSAQAREHLQSIKRHIAGHAPRTAIAYTKKLRRAPEKLRRFPELGAVVPELDDPTVREIIHGNYRIIYRYRDNRALILAVWQGSRPLDSRSLSEEG